MDEDTGLEENPITTNRFHEISEQGLSLYGGLRFRATSICFSYLLSVAAYVRRADRVSRWKFSNNSTRGFFFLFLWTRFYRCSCLYVLFNYSLFFEMWLKNFFPNQSFIFYRLLFDFSIRVFVSFVLVFFVFVFLEMWLKTKKFFPESIFNLLSAPFRFLNTYFCIFRCSNIVFEFSFYCYFFFFEFYFLQLSKISDYFLSVWYFLLMVNW